MIIRRLLQNSLVIFLLGVMSLAVAALAGGDAEAGGGLAVQDLTDAPTPQDLADTLLGGGVDVSNVTYTGDDRAAGVFSGGGGIIGFESGIVLSSGQAQDVVEPNDSSSKGTGLGTSGDSDLASLSGFNTNDAAILEFDFVPSTNLIVFDYVFASEEYNEFVGSSFNDVFAFYAAGANCAVVPNPANPIASLPVSINTINNGDSDTSPTNPGLYINNDPFDADSTGSTVGTPRNTQMDGLTKVLTCSAQVQPGVSNHMKLAIADASDSIYDSAVFIKGGSFVSAEGRVSGRVLGPPPDPVNPNDLVLLEGSMVAVCSIPPCSTSMTDPLGEFVVQNLSADDYHVIAYPPPGRNDLLPADLTLTLASGESKFVGDMIMRKAVAPPGGTQIDSIGSISGVPVLDWGQPTGFSVTGCEGGVASFKVIASNGSILASGGMTESPPGTYSGTIIPIYPYHGPARVEVDIDCPSGPDEDIDFDVYIDPSGKVRTVQGDPIEGATVTLYRSDSEGGPFTQVANGSAIMSPSNRTNPDLTDDEGFFHWDVIAGYYKVRAEKAGCHAPGNAGQAFAETEVLEIPPPALDLDIRLDCGGEPGQQQVYWGDLNCNDIVDPIDSLFILRYDAGLSTNTGACPEIGSQLDLFVADVFTWGNLDCSNGPPGPVDSLKTLRWDGGLTISVLGPNCPDPGQLLTIGAPSSPTPTPTSAPSPTSTQTSTPTASPTSTASPSPTPSPTVDPGTQIFLCWMAIVSNDIVNGFLDGESCVPTPGGNTYTCNAAGPNVVDCLTPSDAGQYSCDTSAGTTWDCDATGFGYSSYDCSQTGLFVECTAVNGSWPNYTCNASSQFFISCTTNHAGYPDFDCTVPGLQYSCNIP